MKRMSTSAMPIIISEAETEADHVPRGIRLGRAAGGRVEGHVADAGQHAEQQHEGPADLPELRGEAERGLADQPPLHNAHDLMLPSAVAMALGSTRFAGSR